MLANKKMSGLAVVALFAIFLVMGGGIANAQVGVTVDKDFVIQKANEDVNAMPAMSTEKRYSAGRFTSDVDRYIDVIDFNPNIGTFFFLGGFPCDDTDVNTDDTSFPTPDTASTLNFGLGKTLNNGHYFALYFSGHIVDAYGTKDEADKGKYNITDSATWQDKLAILYAPSESMSFRFDMLFDGTNTYNTANDKFASSTSGTGGGVNALGLTVGMPGEKGAISDIYFGIGYIFGASSTTQVDSDGFDDPEGKKTRTTYGPSVLGLNAGLGFSENTYLDFWMNLGFQSANKSYEDKVSGGNPNGDQGDHITQGGFNMGAEFSYFGEVDLDKVMLKFRPYVGIDYEHASRDYTDGDGKAHARPGEELLEAYLGVELGARFQVKKTIAMYTGISVDILDFKTDWYPSSGENNQSAWELAGIQWGANRWNTQGGNTTNLSFGLTWEPIENVVIGFGLKTILDKLFWIDLQNMEAGTGDFFTDRGANNVGDWAASAFDGIRLDLTISCSFGGSGKSSDE